MILFWLPLMMFLAVLLLLPLVKVNLHLQLDRNRPGDYLLIEANALFHLFHLHRKVPLAQVKKVLRKKTDDKDANITSTEIANVLDDLHLYFMSVKSVSRIFAYTYWEKFELTLRFGTGEPASTGMATGFFWSLIPTVIYSGLLRVHPWKEVPVIEIIPDFEKLIFLLRVDSIFTVQAGHLIDIGTSLLYQKLGIKMKAMLKN